MKKALAAAIVAIASLAGSSAMAQSGSASVSLSGTVSRFCTMETPSVQIALDTQQTDFSGFLAFTCNFSGAPVVTAASANGGLINSATNAVTDYRLAVGAGAPYGGGPGFVDASSLVNGGQNISEIGNGGAAISAYAPGDISFAMIAVNLSRPLFVAGTYSDTLTITIAP